ncbi:MAG TPA: histidine kinase [Candidatus Nitrosotalea sp.]|nr:histidine kinase [Candidatus Nitrosotalea sp.]
MLLALVAVQGLLTATAAVVIFALLRRRQRGFGSPEEQATLRTLAFATSSLRELRSGLSPKSAARVLPAVALQSGAPAVALYDRERLLAFHAQPAGPGESHRLHLEAGTGAVKRALAGRRLQLVAAHLEAMDGCELRSVIIAPIIVEGSWVAGLATYHVDDPRPAALRIASDLAELLATQLRLQHADDQRVTLASSELKMLRAQIAPHFLYNTLTTIAAFVRTDPARARELLLEFADFSRRAFGGAQGDFASLADELVFVHKYLNLEQARLGDRLSVRYTVDPEILNVNVPVLAIQPLIENAIKHGIEPKRGPGTITIVAEDEDDECRLSVGDDGDGFDVDARDLQSRGALANIDRRLRQVFGADHGLVIESLPGIGTTVHMRVPKYRPGVRPL